jgi:molybdopterin-guanine dinucleotide biosynthesis protein A
LSDRFGSDRVGIVLAGGRSTRFGSDKFIHLVDGVEMGLRAVRALAPVVDRVLVVGRESVPDSWNATALFGAREGSGPLGAILDAADHSPGRVIVVLPCDMPYFASASVSGLCGALESTECEAAFATSAPDAEPQWLASSWRIEAIHGHLRPFYDRGGRSVRDAANLVRHTLVKIPADDLINVNRFADV